MDDDVVGGWAIDPEVRDALRLERARVAFEQGDLDLVMVEAEELLSDNPDHADALALLADATLDAGDAVGAVAIYEHLLTLVEPDDSLLAALGIARFEACDLHGAITASREATRIAPDNADAHYTLGLAFERLTERSSEAVGAFTAAHSLDPERFPFPLHLEARDWERLIARAVGRSPEPVIAFWLGVPVRVEGLPPLSELTAGPVPMPPTLRGLYQGEPPEDPEDTTSRPQALRLFGPNLARLGDEEVIIDAIQDILEAEALDWLGLEAFDEA